MFYQLLDESEAILGLFVDLCARSNFIVRIIGTYPQLFDEVVDGLLTGYSFHAEDLSSQTEAIADRSGDAITAELFAFKYLHLILTAIRELEGDSRIRVTMEQVSAIAEALLRAIVRDADRRAHEKLGAWTGDPPRFTVLGMGKLGGREMTFQSDVDFVFLYDGSAVTDKGIGAQEYFERFLQLVLGRCKETDQHGGLLDVDLRLRPQGSQGSLATSIDAWKAYFRDGSAETWERQALLRARWVAGDEGLATEAIGHAHQEFVLGGSAGPASADVVKHDVWSMRRKLEEHAGPKDLKRGRGGIMDVEFLVQAMQLLHGREHPEIIHANTAIAIERLQQAGILTPSRRIELFNSYQFLRWIECRLSLVADAGERISELDDQALGHAVERIGYRSTGEEPAREIFREELDYHRKKIREALLEALRRRGAGEPTRDLTPRAPRGRGREGRGRERKGEEGRGRERKGEERERRVRIAPDAVTRTPDSATLFA